MELTREAWTDERLDDLARRMDGGFDRVSGDVRELRREMREEFTARRGEESNEFSGVRIEMRDEFAAVRTEMKAEFASVRAEMKAEFAAVRTEMKDGFASIRGELNQQVGSLREENIVIWGEINRRLDGIQQRMLQFGGALIVSFVALILAVLLRGA